MNIPEYQFESNIMSFIQVFYYINTLKHLFIYII